MASAALASTSTTAGDEKFERESQGRRESAMYKFVLKKPIIDIYCSFDLMIVGFFAGVLRILLDFCSLTSHLNLFYLQQVQKRFSPRVIRA